jgi:transcription elongation factor Elf1
VTKAVLVKRLMLDNDEMHYHCTVCPKQFVSKSHMKVHIYKHVGVNPLLCLVCGESFNNYAASEEAQ